MIILLCTLLILVLTQGAKEWEVKYTKKWCHGHVKLWDSSRTFETKNQCQRRCEQNTQCKFFLFGTKLYNNKWNRCVLFSSCGTQTTYQDGSPIIYGVKDVVFQQIPRKEGEPHKIYGNVAFQNENGEPVPASCGKLDRRGSRLTHGRVVYKDGVKTCIDWNTGNRGQESIEVECTSSFVNCCEENELLRYLDREVECYRPPKCVSKDNSQRIGLVEDKGSKKQNYCHFGDETSTNCGGAYCCEEGTNDIDVEGYFGPQCSTSQDQPKRPEVDTPKVTNPIILRCRPDFIDSDGDNCATYKKEEFCDEYYYDYGAIYENGVKLTARLCPECGCKDTQSLIAVNHALKEALKAALN